MDIIWISAAFLMGFAARTVGLPPLVGYLVTGFLLYGAGIRASETLQEFADFGVTLLLFSIGLKLRLRSLLMPQIWAVAGLHMGLTVVFLGCVLYGLATTGLALFSGLEPGSAFIVAFALSFSSTVFAVKVLEDKGELGALYGRISIGILIIQDIAAVIFLALSLGKVPSPWALLLLLLFPLRPLLGRLLDRVGHGELLVLFGLTVALGGAQLFELVGLKGDLGALLIGLLFSNHVKSSELSKHLLGFKDLFLVGFFLTIGLAGLPDTGAMITALLLILLVPLKTLLFFWLMVRLHLRSRTAILASLSLANYSEFGLIVGAIAVSAGWLDAEWLAAIAVGLSVSFVLAAPFNTHAHGLYRNFRDRLIPLETEVHLEEEETISPRDASVLIFGMGRVGTGAYDSLRERFGERVLGLDLNTDQVKKHQAAGRRVIRASAVDPDFWDRFHLADGQVELVMLALPNHQENLYTARQVKARGYSGRLAAIARFPDEVQELLDAGVDAAYNLYAEAGLGFANDVCSQLLPTAVAEPARD